MGHGYWLSILIPVYNVAPWLHACLGSVCDQADAGVEIIVLDDCSTDNSRELLADFIQQSPVPIKFLQHSHNGGLSAARNTMLDAASGTYVWFLDSDDLLEDGAIARLLRIVAHDSPDLVMCDFRVLREQQTFKHRWRGENHRKAFVGKERSLERNPADLFYGLYKKGELHIWSKIGKRALWGDDLRFPVGRYMEDMTTTPRLALRAKTWWYEPAVWVAYRQRAGSILSTPSLKKITDSASGSEGVLADWLATYPQLPSRARLAFSHYCARTHYSTLRDLKRLDASAYAKEKTEYRKRLFNTIHWGRAQLCWEYGRRGLASRLLRFLANY
jgi:glycosyltransferase involved in cell wall biosynthesis